jgi:hypothetical protein
MKESESPHSHWSQCVRRVEGYARDLKKAKARNPEIALRSFVDQPAYWLHWRNELVALGMAAWREA